jgi:hypothetical protein
MFQDAWTHGPRSLSDLVFLIAQLPHPHCACSRGQISLWETIMKQKEEPDLDTSVINEIRAAQRAVASDR